MKTCVKISLLIRSPATGISAYTQTTRIRNKLKHHNQGSVYFSDPEVPLFFLPGKFHQITRAGYHG
ncbi:hypothetical protein [Cytophaga hutchinsonii]|uniref:Uncharacterized protein n=1 Tax=Cytophaga hutchinsonii (strain ATCC 33406 / DSM 1761 / CIP 103989 / NBRC 15051 / NCIMB 9469 / D465) TaxID=269798 RepID=A0A6N4SVK5_CYTH3|nr:hypothetical protein [Cytophaga hutchinsonii]ABG60571.1 hypothetical protein CHU_3335 [Cytophaga hutchinsonii ATCC 33406]